MYMIGIHSGCYKLCWSKCCGRNATWNHASNCLVSIIILITLCSSSMRLCFLFIQTYIMCHCRLWFKLSSKKNMFGFSGMITSMYSQGWGQQDKFPDQEAAAWWLTICGSISTDTQAFERMQTRQSHITMTIECSKGDLIYLRMI